MMSSTLYVGTVVHARLRPRRHRLKYRMFWLLLDLDELPDLSRGLRLFSHNQRNIFSFHDTDHGVGRIESLRAYVARRLAETGLETDGGPIRLLCMPRILGYAFNPISIYYCYARDGRLKALLYEVNNTFGDRHSYLIPVEAKPGEVIQQSCRKTLHVSPFMDMDLDYTFRVAVPGDGIAVAITANDTQGAILTASLAGHRRPLTDGALARLFFTHPLLTLKVIAAIHWQALKLFNKGVTLRSRPNPPDNTVSVVAPENKRRTMHV